MISILKPIEKRMPNSFRLFIRKIYHKMNNKYPYRPYTHDYNCIFIHIPKVAGTSLLKVLMGDSINRDHLSFHVFKQDNYYLFDKYFKFAFVRNPYDRLVSTYEYFKNGGNGSEDLYFSELIKEKYDTFDKFVLEYLSNISLYDHVLFKPQYSFIYDYRYCMKVDFCGRYENLKEDVEYVFARLGINRELEWHNKSKRKDYSSYYINQLVKDKVYELYCKDFELFNYSR